MPSMGLTISGMPLVAYALLNLYNRENIKYNWLIICLYPFCGNLVLGGFTIIVLTLVLFIYGYFKSKEINRELILAFVILTFLFILVEYRNVYQYFFQYENLSSRQTIGVGGYGWDSFISNLKMLMFGNYEGHARSEHKLFINGSVILAIIMNYKSYQKLVVLFKSLSVVYVICIISSIYGYESFDSVKRLFPFINIFNFGRIFFINSFLWYIIFSQALLLIKRSKFNKKFLQILVTLIILSQSVYVIYGHREPDAIIPYKHYFAEENFNSIKKTIGLPIDSFRVLSIGLHPTVASFNGFYTLDGYHNVFPNDYLIPFNKIHEKEINKNPHLLLEAHSKRIYLLISELHGDPSKEGFSSAFLKHRKGQTIKNLELDYEALISIGADYIISSIEILNYQNNKFEFLGKFVHNDSFWDLFLYEIKKNDLSNRI
tara:strand:+ start:48 stop:1340 length:1293 start_codon:yes stop_codon:yes gene_type:complete